MKNCHVINYLVVNFSSSNLYFNFIFSGHLAKNAPFFMQRYAIPTVKILIEKLREETQQTCAVSVAITTTIGHLAAVGGGEMMSIIDDVMPTVIDQLSSNEQLTKRQAALVTLGGFFITIK